MRTLSDEQRSTLLSVARQSIQHGLENGQALKVRLEDFDPELQDMRAAFVTLNKNNQLRGCIGHLQAVQPLVTDVAENAYAAGFRDPRFPKLAHDELVLLDLHISVLSPAEPMVFTSEEHLLEQIRPGIDGLILRDGRYQGTFLPSVWESLPTVDMFWEQLKRKAGLPTTHWSESLTVARYTTESFS